MRKQLIGYIGILLILGMAFTTINCQPATTANTAEPKQCPLAAMGVPCADTTPGKVCPITQGKDPCDSCTTKAKELQAQQTSKTDPNNANNESINKAISASWGTKYPIINQSGACGGNCSTCPSQVKEAVHSHNNGITCANKDKCDKDGKCTGDCTEQEKANCPMHKK